MVDMTRSGQRRLRRIFRWRSSRPMTAEDVSGRITAFVYGNILVLAALIALRPEDLLGPKAIAYVLGTGVSTFLAHVISEWVGSSVHTHTQAHDRAGGGAGVHAGSRFAHLLGDALPIASSALTPALLMAAALLGWVGPTVALLAAIIVTVLRMAGLGWVVGRLRRQPASFRTFLAGIVLAAVCSAVAVLKWWLTH
ncbi:hypothetical protein MN0502_02570 [Arthrobacter sp. MN05-02]|nr:hypothetical protein MN0502_02570 [Arthrobacter sp. MN05-02]